MTMQNWRIERKSRYLFYFRCFSIRPLLDWWWYKLFVYAYEEQYSLQNFFM